LFDLVRRGYDREQVDEHMRTLLTQLAELRQAQQQERRRAEWGEAELRTLRAQLEQQSAQLAENHEQGFGYRVEKLLRAAEQEATEVRSWPPARPPCCSSRRGRTRRRTATRWSSR
jgi:hypothetical protein